MILEAIAYLNLLAELALLFAAALLATVALSPVARVLFLRCVFVVALAAPLTLLTELPRAGLFFMPVSVPEQAAAPAAAFDRASWRSARVESSGGVSTSEFPSSAGPWSLTFDWPVGVLVLWLAGALFQLARLAFSLRTLNRAFRCGTSPRLAWQRRTDVLRATLDVRPVVHVRVSRLIAAPCTFGTLKPKILLPAGHNFSDETIEAVLAHELCHVRHLDAVWQAIGLLACAVHWFNPLIWLCLKRHRDEIEIVCDAAAVRGAGGARNYATALLLTARDMIGVRSAAGLMMSSHGVAARVRHLIEWEGKMPQLTASGRLAAVAAVAGSLLLLGTTDLVAAKPAPERLIRESPALPIRQPVAVAAPVEPVVPPDPVAPAHGAAPGEGILYLSVGGDIVVLSAGGGFMCSDESRCVFSLDRGSNVTMRVSPDSPPVRWTGCAPSQDGRHCTVRISGHPASIDVSRADG